MRLFVIILSLLLQGVLWEPFVNASEANLEWQEAVNAAKQGEYDFAFMDFHSILEFYPGSPHFLAAEFAVGEYYFSQNYLPMAAEQFKNYYARYPQHDESLIALLYLYKIAQIQQDPKAMQEYQKKIASFRQLIFIFNDKKYFKYVSGFKHKYKLIYTINKVGLYVDGKLFTEVPF